MSNYLRTLRHRKEALGAAHHEVEEADDQFLDPADEDFLDRARDNIEDVLNNTHEELEVLEQDWELVGDHAETILDMLTNAAEQLEEDGLVVCHHDEYRVTPALDDEPETIEDLRRFINNAMNDWWEVRRAADEVLEDI